MDIPGLVTTTWTALQPYLPILATKGAEELGKTAVGKIWNAIEARLSSTDHTKTAVQDLKAQPNDADVQGQFRWQLRKTLEQDAAFLSQLTELLKEVGAPTYNATVIGDGAIAQGPGAISLAPGANYIAGNVSGGIHQGDKK